MTVDHIYDLLRDVYDPEIPVLNLVELGVVRRVDLVDGAVEVDITPTYSGCPAMKVMEAEIVAKLREAGVETIRINTVWSPAWTTDWMSAETHRKLKEYGIAPPGQVAATDLNPRHYGEKKVPCPYCDSEDTVLKSQFGSTACKAMYACNSCRQPFEHFKCI